MCLVLVIGACVVCVSVLWALTLVFSVWVCCIAVLEVFWQCVVMMCCEMTNMLLFHCLSIKVCVKCAEVRFAGCCLIVGAVCWRSVLAAV